MIILKYIMIIIYEIKYQKIYYTKNIYYILVFFNIKYYISIYSTKI